MASTGFLDTALQQCRRSLWIAFLQGFFVNALLLVVSIYSMQVFDRVLGSGSIETLLALSLVVAVSLAFMAVFHWLRGAVLARCGSWLETALADTTASLALSASLRVPELGAQPLRDIAALRAFIVSPALAAALDAPWALIYLAVVFLISPVLGWFLLACAVCLAILAIIAEWQSKRTNEAAGDAKLKSIQAFEGLARHAEAIRAMGFGRNALQRWRNHESESRSRNHRAAMAALVWGAVVKSLRLLVQCGVTGVAAWLVISGRLSGGAIIAATMLASKALTPIDALASIVQGWSQARAAYRRLAKIAAATGETTDAAAFDMPRPTGRITLSNVSYRLPDTDRWLFKGLTVDIRRGESVALVGPSGVGKTTLMRILTGVVAPTTGRVALDGADMRFWNEDALGPSVGYLPQDVELLPGTVAANIARFDPHATDEEVVAAARFARVHDLIVSLPMGYATEIDAAARTLSAGQRQRIGLARAFFGDVKLVILDEPNANLDAAGEDSLVGVLRDARARGVTTIVSAHRRSILAEMDKVLMLAPGGDFRFGPAAEILPRQTAERRATLQAAAR